MGASLMAILRANATQMYYEFDKAKMYSLKTGQAIQNNLTGGSTGGLTNRTGAIREMLVLMREISRGNWTRVPGSFTLLLDRLGALGPVMSLGLGTALTVVAAITAVAVVAYERFWGMKKAMEGMGDVALKLEYIPKMLRASADWLNMQRNITDEVQKTADAYNSAASAQSRVSKTISEHYAHLMRMNELERDPAKRQAGELRIRQQERNTMLASKMAELQNAEIQSANKQREASGIKVHTAQQEADIRKEIQQNADAATKYLADKGIWGLRWDEVKKEMAIDSQYVSPGGDQTPRAHMAQAEQENYDKAMRALTALHTFSDKEEDRNVLRKQKADAEAEAAKSAALVYQLRQEIPEIQKANAQAAADDAEYAAANVKMKLFKGNVDSLQKIGAYTSPATTALVDIQNRALGHLAKIDAGVNGRGSTSSRVGGVRH